MIDHEIVITNKMKIDDKENVINVALDKKSISSIK